MKNISKIGLAFLAVSVFALSGCGNKNAENTGAQNQQKSSAENSGQSAVDAVKNKLYDMVTTGAGVKCTIEDPKMGQMTMFAKGEKAKVEGFQFMPMSNAFSNVGETAPPKEEKGTMINDGTWAYMWSGKEGMKFNIKEMESLAPQDQKQEDSQTGASDWKDWVKQMDEKGVKYDCSPTALSDSDFAAPNDVKFVDWGEMMKGFVKMGEEMKNKASGQMPPVGQ